MADSNIANDIASTINNLSEKYNLGTVVYSESFGWIGIGDGVNPPLNIGDMLTKAIQKAELSDRLHLRDVSAKGAHFKPDELLSVTTDQKAKLLHAIGEQMESTHLNLPKGYTDFKRALDDFSETSYGVRRSNEKITGESWRAADKSHDLVMLAQKAETSLAMVTPEEIKRLQLTNELLRNPFNGNIDKPNVNGIIPARIAPETELSAEVEGLERLHLELNAKSGATKEDIAYNAKVAGALDKLEGAVRSGQDVTQFMKSAHDLMSQAKEHGTTDLAVPTAGKSVPSEKIGR